uniref:Uncharacterized protein n=1 Tax=Anguilla anguilla TaxID=7936 RepID=A0A0E9XMQ9_ANGAN
MLKACFHCAFFWL